MQTSFAMKNLMLALTLSGLPAMAGDLEAHLTRELGTAAKCDCKNAGECTCPKGECKCKNCGNGQHRLVQPLKGASESTRLPDTARLEDARAGVMI